MQAILYRIFDSLKRLSLLSIFYTHIVFAGCIPAPSFDVMNEGKVTVNVNTNNNIWVSTGTNVSSNKSLKMAWSTSNLYKYPQKYRILYRIDPRFNRPQVIIKAYNYSSNSWVSDFNTYVGKYGADSLNEYANGSHQADDPMAIFQDLSNYFSFSGRAPITVKAGDLINVALISSTDFFNTPGWPNADPNPDNNPVQTHIYTGTGIYVDNSVVHISIAALCNYLQANPSVYNPSFTCNSSYFQSYDSGALTSGGLGFGNASGMPVCNAQADGIQSSACYYNNGRGMTISVGGNVIKPTSQGFTSSNATRQAIFSTIATSAGMLDFNTSWHIDNMYHNIPRQFMSSWTLPHDASELKSAQFNYIHIGRYFLEVEIGNAFGSVGSDSVDIEYAVSNSTPSGSGTLIAANNEIFPANSGTLWVKVNSNSYSTGDVTIYYANYTGDTGFSSFVSNTIVDPICKKVRILMITLYSNLSGSAIVKSISISLLTLYIILYGLFFLAGAVAVKLHDLVYRVIKISIVVAMFSVNSWTIFNDNLFKVFTEGTRFLIFNIIGTNGSDNMFGFVDLIFQKYLNGYLWLNLLIELLDFSSGLTFAAILVIIGLLKYLFAVSGVIISYIISFIMVSVLISIAPIFILFSLFSRTSHLFKNWLSAIFNAAFYPTLLLLFFLMIDDILVSQLQNAVLGSCWDTAWIPFKFSIGIAIPGYIKAFQSFTLPFLPGIPFYAPNVSNGSIISGDPSSYLGVMGASIIFYCFANMTSNLSSYVTAITGMLTSIGSMGGGIAGQQGVHSIESDAKDAPFAIFRKPLNFLGDSYRGGESFRRSFGKFVDFSNKVTNRSKDNGDGGGGASTTHTNPVDFHPNPSNLGAGPHVPPPLPPMSSEAPEGTTKSEEIKNVANSVTANFLGQAMKNVASGDLSTAPRSSVPEGTTKSEEIKNVANSVTANFLGQAMKNVASGNLSTDPRPSVPEEFAKDEGVKRFSDMLIEKAKENLAKQGESDGTAPDFEKAINQASEDLGSKYLTKYLMLKDPKADISEDFAKLVHNKDALNYLPSCIDAMQDYYNLKYAKNVLNASPEYRDAMIKDSLK